MFLMVTDKSPGKMFRLHTAGIMAFRPYDFQTSFPALPLLHDIPKVYQPPGEELFSHDHRFGNKTRNYKPEVMRECCMLFGGFVVQLHVPGTKVFIFAFSCLCRQCGRY
jgi:hypothetical protein